MATILEFRCPSSRTTPASAAPGATAEIVIFPGIRYERWPEADRDDLEDQPAHGMPLTPRRD